MVEDGGYPNPSQEILWTLEKQRKWFTDLPHPPFYNSEVEQNNTASEEWLNWDAVWLLQGNSFLSTSQPAVK